MLPQMLWNNYFLEAYGYGINENYMYQDNLITTILRNNGKE